MFVNESLRASLVPHARAVVLLHLRAFFDAEPKVRTITWVQSIDERDEFLCGVAGVRFLFAGGGVYDADHRAIVSGLAAARSIASCDALADRLAMFSELVVIGLGGAANVHATRTNIDVTSHGRRA